MTDPFREQKIQNWAAEFAESDAAKKFPSALQEQAGPVAEAFLRTACNQAGVEPEGLNEAAVKAGLLDGVGRLSLPPAGRAKAPDFCIAFLESLQQQGRIPAGRTLTALLKALRSAYLSRANVSGEKTGRREPDAPKQAPIVRSGEKLGPNDPCPCGSGKKYKKCCKRGLN